MNESSAKRLAEKDEPRPTFARFGVAVQPIAGEPGVHWFWHERQGLEYYDQAFHLHRGRARFLTRTRKEANAEADRMIAAYCAWAFDAEDEGGES